MRAIKIILIVSMFCHQSYGQKSTFIQIDNNLKLTFSGELIIDSSENDIIKYLSKTANAGYQLLTIDSFEVDSPKDMHNRLNGLLDGFKTKGLFQTHKERRADTSITNVNGVYMIVTDTSNMSLYKKSQFFYTVVGRRFYGLQIFISSIDSATLSEERLFFSNLHFSGEPYYKPGADASNLTKIFWFIAIAICLGFGIKSMVERR